MLDRPQLTIVRDYPALITALRARKEALGWSHKTVDGRTGLSDGYLGKLFGPRPPRNLGPIAFTAVLQTLGLGVAVVEVVPLDELRPQAEPRRKAVHATGSSMADPDWRVRRARQAARARWGDRPLDRAKRMARKAAREARRRRKAVRLAAAAASPAAT
jgi:hypothetical protein